MLKGLKILEHFNGNDSKTSGNKESFIGIFLQYSSKLATS